MRRIIAFAHISLDGVMQAPGGPQEDPGGGFPYGGWSRGIGDEQFDRIVMETIAGDYDLLLGRLTYDIWADYWPQHGDNEVGRKFNAARKYVVTNTLEQPGWENSQRIAGNVVEQLWHIKESAGPEEIHVWGSTQLLQTLTAVGLVDEYRLWVYPLVLGQGKRLFEVGLPMTKLRLTASQSTPGGIVLNSYEKVKQELESQEQ